MSAAAAVPALAAAVPIPDLTLPPGAVPFVNVVLAVVMFGVAIDLNLDQLRRTLNTPRALLVGVGTQFLVLPALSAGLIAILSPPPAIALGMLVVACVPGGTVSNVLVHLGDGNTPLSIAMTGASTLLALLVTPLNLTFWGGRLDAVAPVLREVALEPADLVVGLVAVLLLPVALGLVLQVRRPELARRLVLPFRIAAVVGLVVLVVGAIVGNLGGALDALRAVIVGVVLHNAVGLLTGYGAASAARLPVPDRRAMSIEIGVQNAALALALGLAFFPGQPAVALVAAVYGAWHVVAGLVLARVWSGRPLWRPAPR